MPPPPPPPSSPPPPAAGGRRRRDDPDTPKDPRAQAKRLSVLRRLLPMVWPHRRRFALATLFLVVGSSLNLVYPQAARAAIDAGLGDATTGTLDKIAAAVVVVFVLNAAVTWGRHYLMSWLGERVVSELRSKVYHKMLEQPLSWFHARPTGELTGRLAADVGTIQSIVGSELSMALREVVMLIGGLVMLFIQSWKLTLGMLMIIPPVMVVGFVFGKRIRTMSNAAQDKLAETSAMVQESVGAIATVQAFVQEPVFRRRYDEKVDDFFGRALQLSSWRGLFIATMSFLGWIATAAMLWLGARQIIAGTLSAGDLTAFLLYTTMVAFALGGLANLWGSLQSAAGATQRLFDILDKEPDIKDAAFAEDVDEDAPAAFAFEDVTFAYDRRVATVEGADGVAVVDAPVLRGVTLRVNAGETVAVVGRSGAGKSTLASLLYRFYDVDAGRVVVFGDDVRGLRLASLRKRLAIVSQDPVLFAGTIHDNIAFARPDASRADVERAAQLAHAHAFTSSFPDGYDTVIGERGVRLSGGQRQRIAIARALLADPKILVLDEATSSLDGESEALVHEALATLMKGRTTLVIAHRLSTVKDADRIVVLDRGAVVDEGKHDELVGKDGIYRTLVEHQLIRAAA
jgi:ABC transporter fused permease/ATP-binding protein